MNRRTMLKASAGLALATMLSQQGKSKSIKRDFPPTVARRQDLRIWNRKLNAEAILLEEDRICDSELFVTNLDHHNLDLKKYWDGRSRWGFTCGNARQIYSTQDGWVECNDFEEVIKFVFIAEEEQLKFFNNHLYGPTWNNLAECFQFRLYNDCWVGMGDSSDGHCSTIDGKRIHLERLRLEVIHE